MKDQVTNNFNDEVQLNNNGMTWTLIHAISPELLMIVFWVLLKLC